MEIVLLDQNTTAGEREAALTAIRQAEAASRIAVGAITLESAGELTSALSAAAADTILFVDPASARNTDLLIQFMMTVEQNDALIQYAASEFNGEHIELPELRVENIIRAISHCSAWPLGAVAVRGSVIRDSLPIDGSLTEFLAKTMLSSAIQGESVTEVQTAGKAACAVMLSDETRARLLGYAVNSCNIEDLFPDHAWRQHEEESAAACYHTLAALFIRLGDIETARECLQFSDQLEDSPRSQALKALISFAEGETLGAVANLISSLQQYEVRKRNDQRHYLSFSPSNLAGINKRLHEGLHALNNQDNRGALTHFAAAVFDFDSFYTDNGLDSLIH